MAQKLLVSILVHTTPGGTFVDNDVVNVYWNTSTESIDVTLNGSAHTPTSASQIGRFNTNYYVSGITSYEGQYAISGYSFCDGDDLVWFMMLMDFPMPPFMQKQITVDSPVCGTAVCDLHFNGVPIVTNSTDLLSNNGQIIVSASSSNGTVKYGLTNFTYATGGQTSGTLTGLSPGTYTVYAKDANDCTAQIQVTVLFRPTYAEHYRFSWYSDQIQNGTSRHERLRVYDRGYPGDVVEVQTAGVSPFILNKPKQGDLNNKFQPIHTTDGVMAFMNEVDYQYLPLYTEDDKKFKGVYEVDEGSGFTPVWSGFEIPSVYQENFIATPYPTAFRFADNVKLLEKAKFADDNGQLINGVLKLIKVIALIMKKTGLELSIRSGINIFEENHATTDTDDPLDQTYIDVACYRDGADPFTCWQVLEEILKPFGARIYQCDNQWQIEEIDRATESYDYRLFDFNGDYLSNGTFDPIVEIKAPTFTDRVALVDKDHSMEIIPSYGSVKITSALNYVGSIIAGSFEKEDLLSPEAEVTTFFPGIFKSEEGFKDWSLRQPAGITGVSFGRTVLLSDGDAPIKHISDADLASSRGEGHSVGAFYFNGSSWAGNLRDSYIETAEKPFQYGPNGEVKVSFDYSTLGAVGYPFIVLRFSIKIGANYLQNDFKTWDSSECILRRYPQPSTKLQTFEAYIKTPFTSAIIDSTIQLRIYYYAADFYDFGAPSATDDPDDATDGDADLVAFDTVDIDYPYKADLRFHDGNGGYGRIFVELRLSTAAEDIAAGIIHPHDYNASTNKKIWFVVGNVMEGDKTLDPAGHNARNRLFYLDNVNVDAYTNGQEAPREDVLDLNISKYVDEPLEVELFNMDVPPDIVNGKNMYNNYFRLSDGTPTSAWARSGITESLTLQEILLRVLGSNHAAPTFRLTGSFINEFSRIGVNNYLKLTKPGSSVVAVNTTFDSDLSSWLQTGTGTSFAWASDNGGSAEVTLTGTTDSKKLYQEITHDGGYIQLTGDVAIVPDAANDREDILWAVFFRDSLIVHAEKVNTFLSPTSSSSFTINHRAFAPGSVTAIGFFFQNINGTGECAYQVGEFSFDGVDVVEIYQIPDMVNDCKANRYTFELMQLSKSYISLSGIDTGGTNQGGGSSGRAHSSGYSSGYN